MTQSSSLRPIFDGLTLITRERAAPSITGAPLTRAGAAARVTWLHFDRYGASSIVETTETNTPQPTKPSPPSPDFVVVSKSLFLWLCFLAAASTVTGLYAALWIATSGGHWLVR